MSTNEIKFSDLFKNININFEKQEKYYIPTEKIEVSLDFSFEYNNALYLIEVDSLNYYKSVFGQYVLLNNIEELKKSKKNIFYIVINYYKDNNKEINKNRIEKYLKFAKDNLNCKIPYIVLLESEFEQIIKNSDGKIDNFVNKIIDNANKFQREEHSKIVVESAKTI